MTIRQIALLLKEELKGTDEKIVSYNMRITKDRVEIWGEVMNKRITDIYTLKRI